MKAITKIDIVVIVCDNDFFKAGNFCEWYTNVLAWDNGYLIF